MDELIPCPFCGEAKRLELFVGITCHKGQEVGIACKACSAQGPTDYVKDPKDYMGVASQLWNKRK